MEKTDLSTINLVSDDFRIFYGDVTPDIASRWLKDANKENRKLRNIVVTTYADAIEKGLWEDNQNSIKFKKNGILLDGQHRLSAIVKSNISIPCLIYVGMDDTIHMDDGVKRTTSDLIKMSNLELPRVYTRSWSVATANLALTIKEKGEIGLGMMKKYDPLLVKEWISRHKNALEFAERSTNGNNRETRRMNSSAILLAVVSAYEYGVSVSILEAWADGVCTGVYNDRNFGINGAMFTKYFDRNIKMKNRGQYEFIYSAYKTCMHSIKLSELGQISKVIKEYNRIDYPLPL